MERLGEIRQNKLNENDQNESEEVGRTMDCGASKTFDAAVKSLTGGNLTFCV